ncbi:MULTISPECIES: ABC transporter permease [Leptospira]|uniref:ABC-2 family transporter protein n=5 Tax=Leptospira borgpetersenii TaxID=174 RepID=M3HKH0_LEPBO|nr:MULTISPECIES: ABC transporter permease subunit [Leptospira]EMF98565.1 ABC-2 family transporter protein [Leptospira borgpetersenii str. 200701203]EMO07630.1 ABC-2 family transporter protein [Leptospira borgpetersenii str. Noumea 25]EMO65243.1 ABC-2 family transporter protein [Leptospira borgpetersenii serovar Pomona str. 200901868]ALO28044.1 ABC-2 family transporter protein [Leptospira borgpetersenii serovar Ballum]ANH02202.1 ABC-2 family transporter protein [Leptospira borgpetersenii str. 4
MLQNIKWIFFKEVKVFFGTFMAPLVFGGTAFLNSLFVLILNFNSGTNYVDTTVITFLSFMSTIIIAMLILAMGSITEERNRGTLEFLFTAPITDLEIVVGKFAFGTLICLLISVFVNGLFPIFLYSFWKAPLYIVVSGTIGVFLLGIFSFAIGLFGSSLGKNQMISLLISIVIILTLWVSGYFSYLFDSVTRKILYHLHIFSHFISFCKGVLPLNGIVFFVSGALFFLYLTVKVLESRRWRG